MIISKWNDKKLKLGWTVKLNNGKLAKITWINGKNYTAKVIEPQPELILKTLANGSEKFTKLAWSQE